MQTNTDLIKPNKKMDICIFLHFYQPINQQLDILDRVVHESYLPVTRLLLKSNKAKITVNFNGSLVDLLKNPPQDGQNLIDTSCYKEVLDNLKLLVEQGKIELTGSAKYHPFLPLIPEEEISRQIELNFETLNPVLGGKFLPKGFFSPEMAVSNKVLQVASKNGFDWVVCPELSYNGVMADTHKKYIHDQTGLKLIFRNKRVSSLILSTVCRDINDLLKETQDIFESDSFWFCVMDAETFGHHRVGHEDFLFNLLESEYFNPVFVSDLLAKDLPEEKIEIRPCTWSNEEQDFWLDKETKVATEVKSFMLWHDPENPIHSAQWELTDFVLNMVRNWPDKSSSQYKKARDMLDRALSSDQYWWASAKPWWSLEMIELGAYETKEILKVLGCAPEDIARSEEIYRHIMDIAFEWQRTGLIRKKYLSNSGTYLKASFKDRTPLDWYNLMVLEFESEMNLSAQRRDFEKAIKWRDALIKIKKGTDIYDVLHVVDELWAAKHLPTLKAFLQYGWDELSDFSKDYLLDRAGNKITKEEFEKWKKELGHLYKEYKNKMDIYTSNLG